MPELPEVETVKSVIAPQITGLKIKEICVRTPGIIAHPGPEKFVRRLTGQKVSGMSRRGKFLTIRTECGDRIVLHLRMTGCLLVTPGKAAEECGEKDRKKYCEEYPEEKHTHLIFRLSEEKEGVQKELRFSDMRRFGRFWLLRDREEDTYTGMEKLGLEPEDKELTAEYLRAHFGRSRKAVKTCLLDQSVIAGIGNIYADEILFTAGIHPARPANSLLADEWESLAEVIPERIAYFIEKNRITPEEYLETKGQDYRNTPYLQAYGHEGERCPVCGNAFCRIVVGGRGSTCCPRCQKSG